MLEKVDQTLFLNPSNIQNILVRVTGSNRSEILGKLETSSGSSANLFLINPNGIVFGPNATLNLGGSFLTSTASGIKFADGIIFSATSPPTIPLLTVSAPIGLQFGATAGEINQQGILAVSAGKTLALVGGNVSLDGGNVSLERNSLLAPDGQIALGGILGVGTIGLNLDSKNQTLSFPNEVVLANVLLRNQARLDVSGEGGGYIQIQGRSIALTDTSQVFAETKGSQNGREIYIEAEQLTLQDGSQLTTSARESATGSGGSLNVKVTDSVQVIGTVPSGITKAGNPSGLFTRTFGQGAAGNLSIETGKLIVQDGGNVSASSRNGTGSGGTLKVTATEVVKLSGTSTITRKPSGLFAQTEGMGNGGSLTIKTPVLIVQNGAQITSANTDLGSRGKGGTLTILASDFVELSGTSPYGSRSGLFTQTQGIGDAGSLTIDTRQLTVKDGAVVSSGTSSGSQGKGGNLTVRASEFVELSGTSPDSIFLSGLFTQTEGIGDGGSLTIETPVLIVRDGAVVSAGTRSQGKGGALTVHASDFVKLSGTAPDGFSSGLFARSRGSGDAGSLSITTGQLIVRDKAEVTVAALGSGNAGNLEVVAREIRLGREGKLLADTRSGKGGNINLQLQNLLLLRDNSQISTTAGTDAAAGGNGGNININIPKGFIVAVPNENSDISANAFTGSAGKVEITAYDVFGIEKRSREDLEKLLGTNEPTKLNPQRLQTNDITAISQTNPTLNGVVNLNTPDIRPNEALIKLPTQPVEPKLAQVCKAGAGRNQNSFTITGRGGVPSSPTESLNADAVLADWITLDRVSETLSTAPVTQNPTKPNRETIVEATGWEINAKGEVVLTVNLPNVTSHSSWQKSTDCGAPQVSS